MKRSLMQRLLMPRAPMKRALMQRKPGRRLMQPLCLLLCLALAGCSAEFFYSRLDWMIARHIEDYVRLEPAQRQTLDGLLKSLLAWHREEELPRYTALLQRIEQDAAAELTAAAVQAWYGEALAAWERIEAQALPMTFALGRALSDAQIAEFIAAIRKEQAEFEEKFLERSEIEYRDDVRGYFRDNLSDRLGRLVPAQQERIDAAVADMRRNDREWLAERARGVEALAAILALRAPGWEDAVRDAMDAIRENPGPGYAETFAHNQTVIHSAIAEVLNLRTEKQSRRLKHSLAALRRDLDSLIPIAGAD